MNPENLRVQMRKGALELCVLRILNHREAYASEILATLRTAELLVVEGTLYPLLTRMRTAGWLDYRWVESTEGPPRKYYRLTGGGRGVLQDLSGEWLRFVQAVEALNPDLSTQVPNPTIP